MKFLKLAIFFCCFVVCSNLSAITLSTKGRATNWDLTAAKKEALLIAKSEMMKEREKIMVYWAEKAFPSSDYHFYNMAKRMARKSFPCTSRERVKHSKKEGYTVSLTLIYSESNKEAVKRFLNSFEKEMGKKRLSDIKYDRQEAAAVLKEVISRW